MDLENLKYGPYSPSRLETSICGLNFWNQYINPDRPKEKSVGSLPQERGSAVHEVLEKITQAMVVDKNACFSEAQIREWVSEAVRAHPVSNLETGDIIKMAKLYIQKPPAMLTSDAQTELKLAVKWDATSSKFVECDYNDPKAVGRGRADIFMINDDLTIAHIIDHKTQPNIEDADTFQLGFYAWVIFILYPYLTEIRTVLHFARYGCYSQEYVWTREQLADIEDEILTRIHIAENKTEWTPVPYKNCQYCTKLLECPVYKEVIDINEVGMPVVKMNNFHTLGDTNKAIFLAGLIVILEEIKKKATSALKDHVKQSSAIAIPGVLFDFRAETKVDWDKVNKTLKLPVCDIFKKHNVDPLQFMGFSQTFSKSVWMIDNEVLVKELSLALPKKTSTEFGSQKV